MKKFFSILLIISLTLIITQGDVYSKAKKRVLLEQHTGAWCGWCPHGTHIMDSLEKAVPDDIIGVKLHWGNPPNYPDEMRIPEATTLAQSFPGGGSYPSGQVDRTAFQVGQNVYIFLSRSIWAVACSVKAAEQAVCSVDLYYEINKSTRQLTANISATFDINVTGDTRFNVYVCENSVSGSGPGWDQANYLSNRPGYEHTPYYSKPNPMTNYKHQKVVRTMLGGIWGEESSLPANCQAGQTYSYQFTYTLPQNWNIDNLFLVGIVQEFNQSDLGLRKILNCAYGIEGSPSTELSYTGELFDVVAKGNAFEKVFTIKNMSDKSITYTAEIKKSARTPSDWSATLNTTSSNEKVGDDIIQASDVTVPKNSSKNITVIFKAGNTIGIGDATLTVVEKTGGSPKEATITAISEEVENIEIPDDEGSFGTQYSLKSIVASTGRQYLQITTEDLSKFLSDLPNLKYVLWSCGQRGGLSGEEADLLQRLVMGQKGILLTGSVSIPLLVTDAGNHPFLQSIGLSWSTASELANINSFDLKGVQYDPITEGLSITGLQLLQTSPPGFWLQPLNIMNSTICNTILNVEYLPTSGPKQSKPIGYRTENGEFRCVVLSFNPSIITNSTVRKDLIDKALKWIEVGGGSNAPDLLLDISSLDFETVDVGKSKELTFDITNGGKSNLEIQKLEFIFETNAFEFVNLPALPITIEPEAKQTLTLKFAPDEDKDYTDLVEITSNDPDGVQSITLYGVGKGASSVMDGKYEIEGLFSMSAGPNPMSEKTVIQYNYNSIIPANIELYIIDATGRRIFNIVNSAHSQGTYSVQFNSTGLANGKYFVVANVNGNTIQMPLVITK